ncbi:MAG: hypothetical protein P8Y63_06600 [Deltaproteobacteria bacterium]|jgi:hypothetical protein
MQKQKDMEEVMLRAHREFIDQLNKALDLLDAEIKEAAEMESICTDEWCYTTDVTLDELHKQVYSISEPRWATEEDSRKISELRKRIKTLYNQFLEAKKVSA